MNKARILKGAIKMKKEFKAVKINPDTIVVIPVENPGYEYELINYAFENTASNRMRLLHLFNHHPDLVHRDYEYESKNKMQAIQLAFYDHAFKCSDSWVTVANAVDEWENKNDYWGDNDE